MQLRETGYKEIACSQELAKNRTIQGESEFPPGGDYSSCLECAQAFLVIGQGRIYAQHSAE